MPNQIQNTRDHKISSEPVATATGPRGVAVNDLRALYDVIRMESCNGCSDALHTINYFVTHRRVPLSEYELDFIKALNFAAIRESEARTAREYIL